MQALVEAPNGFASHLHSQSLLMSVPRYRSTTGLGVVAAAEYVSCAKGDQQSGSARNLEGITKLEAHSTAME